MGYQATVNQPISFTRGADGETEKRSVTKAELEMIRAWKRGEPISLDDFRITDAKIYIPGSAQDQKYADPTNFAVSAYLDLIENLSDPDLRADSSRLLSMNPEEGTRFIGKIKREGKTLSAYFHPRNSGTEPKKRVYSEAGVEPEDLTDENIIHMMAVADLTAYQLNVTVQQFLKQKAGLAAARVAEEKQWNVTYNSSGTVKTISLVTRPTPEIAQGSVGVFYLGEQIGGYRISKNVPAENGESLPLIYIWAEDGTPGIENVAFRVLVNAMVSGNTSQVKWASQAKINLRRTLRQTVFEGTVKEMADTFNDSSEKVTQVVDIDAIRETATEILETIGFAKPLAQFTLNRLNTLGDIVDWTTKVIFSANLKRLTADSIKATAKKLSEKFRFNFETKDDKPFNAKEFVEQVSQVVRAYLINLPNTESPLATAPLTATQNVSPARVAGVQRASAVETIKRILLTMQPGTSYVDQLVKDHQDDKVSIEDIIEAAKLASMESRNRVRLDANNSRIVVGRTIRGARTATAVIAGTSREIEVSALGFHYFVHLASKVSGQSGRGHTVILTKYGQGKTLADAIASTIEKTDPDHDFFAAIDRAVESLSLSVAAARLTEPGEKKSRRNFILNTLRALVLTKEAVRNLGHLDTQKPEGTNILSVDLSKESPRINEKSGVVEYTVKPEDTIRVVNGNEVILEGNPKSAILKAQAVRVYVTAKLLSGGVINLGSTFIGGKNGASSQFEIQSNQLDKPRGKLIKAVTITVHLPNETPKAVAKNILIQFKITRESQGAKLTAQSAARLTLENAVKLDNQLPTRFRRETAGARLTQYNQVTPVLTSVDQSPSFRPFITIGNHTLYETVNTKDFFEAVAKALSGENATVLLAILFNSKEGSPVPVVYQIARSGAVALAVDNTTQYNEAPDLFILNTKANPVGPEATPTFWTKERNRVVAGLLSQNSLADVLRALNLVQKVINSISQNQLSPVDHPVLPKEIRIDAPDNFGTEGDPAVAEFDFEAAIRTFSHVIADAHDGSVVVFSKVDSMPNEVRTYIGARLAELKEGGIFFKDSASDNTPPRTVVEIHSSNISSVTPNGSIHVVVAHELNRATNWIQGARLSYATVSVLSNASLINAATGKLTVTDAAQLTSTITKNLSIFRNFFDVQSAQDLANHILGARLSSVFTIHPFNWGPELSREARMAAEILRAA